MDEPEAKFSEMTDEEIEDWRLWWEEQMQRDADHREDNEMKWDAQRGLA